MQNVMTKYALCIKKNAPERRIFYTCPALGILSGSQLFATGIRYQARHKQDRPSGNWNRIWIERASARYSRSCRCKERIIIHTTRGQKERCLDCESPLQDQAGIRSEQGLRNRF